MLIERTLKLMPSPQYAISDQNIIGKAVEIVDVNEGGARK